LFQIRQFSDGLRNYLANGFDKDFNRFIAEKDPKVKFTKGGGQGDIGKFAVISLAIGLVSAGHKNTLLCLSYVGYC